MPGANNEVHYYRTCRISSIAAERIPLRARKETPVATFNLRRFCRHDALSCIEPTHLLRLLEPYKDYFAGRGFVLPDLSCPRIDLQRLLGILVTPDADTPPRLMDALYYIHAMSTGEGMDLLLPEVDVTGCQPSLLGEYHAADIAVKAWLDNPEMVQRKHAELHMRDFRAFLHFRASRRPLPTFLPPSPEHLRTLDERLDEAFAKKNRGRGRACSHTPRRTGPRGTSSATATRIGARAR
jgi:hypothetical protein